MEDLFSLDIGWQAPGPADATDGVGGRGGHGSTIPSRLAPARA